MPVMKEEAKTEALKRLNDYIKLVQETMPEEENELFAEFSVSVQALSEMTDELYKQDDKGEYPAFTVEKLNALITSYQKVIVNAGAILRGTGKTKMDKARREIADSIKELASQDVSMLASLDESKLTTLPKSIEAGRMLTLDLGNQEIHASSGKMSSRIPVQYTDATGKVIKGFFTEETIFDPKADVKTITDKMRTKYPQLAELFDAMNRVEPVEDNFNYFADEYYINHEGWENNSENTVVVKFLMKMGFKYDKAIQIKNTPGFKEWYFEMNKEFTPYLTAWGCFGEDKMWLRLPRKSNIDSRNSAMSTVANLLGMPNIIAKAEPMEIIIGGKKIKGTFMANVEGKEFYNLNPDDPIRTYPQEAFDSHLVFDQMANLQILDYICGNIDRHEGNFFMQFDTKDPNHPKLSKITGIDNDMSFGTFVPTEKTKKLGNAFVKLSNLFCIPRKTFDMLLGVDESILRTALRNFNFSEQELSACWARLSQIKSKAIEDMTFFREHPEESVQSGRIKIIEDNEWENYTLDSFCKIYNGLNRVNNPIYITAGNLFGMFSNVKERIMKNVLREENINKAQNQPIHNVKKAPLVGKILPKEYISDNEVNKKASAKYAKTMQALSMDVLDDVSDAELIGRGSEEFKLMANKLREISKKKYGDQLNSTGESKLGQQYEELAILAYNYIEKKNLERKGDEAFGKNTTKRIAAARRVLELAASFKPDSSCFVFDNRLGSYKPIEATNAYDETRIKQAYDEIKYFYPKIKIDINKARELLDDNQIDFGNAHGLKVIEKEASQYVRDLGLIGVGTSTRVLRFLFYKEEVPKEYIDGFKKVGIEGFEFRKNVAKDIVEKILEIDDDMFKDIESPNDCVELVREHGDIFGFLYDLNSTMDLFKEFNYHVDDNLRRRIEKQYAKYRPIINSIRTTAETEADPVKFLFNPECMSPKDSDMLAAAGLSGKLKGPAGQFSLKYGSTYENSRHVRKDIAICNNLGAINAFGTFAAGRANVDMSGNLISEKDLVTKVASNEIFICFKENETKGIIISGAKEDGKLITKEGDILDAFMILEERMLAELEETNVGKTGDSSQIKDFAQSLRNLNEKFTLENVKDACEKADAYIRAKAGQKLNERREKRIDIARKFKNRFGDNDIVKAFEARKDSKKRMNQANQRAEKAFGEIKANSDFSLKTIHTNKVIAQFEDMVSNIKDPETKKLGILAIKAKKRLNEITRKGNFNKPLQKEIADLITVTVAFEEKKIKGNEARTPVQLKNDPYITQLAASMDRDRCKMYVCENMEEKVYIEINKRIELEKVEKAEKNNEKKGLGKDELNKSAMF